jgi:hypothetical protein
MSENREPSTNHWFEQSLQESVQKVDQLTIIVSERQLLKSICTGGQLTAKMAVSNCEGLNHHWGEGSQPKAQALIRLFAWIMLSQCYRWTKTESSQGGQSLPPIIDYGRKLLSVFGDAGKTDENLLLGLDSQYNYDLDNKPHLTHISCMLLAASCEICGHRCIDWQKIRFPVREISHLAHKQALIDTEPLQVLTDISALKTALNTGIAAMIQYYEHLED